MNLIDFAFLIAVLQTTPGTLHHRAALAGLGVYVLVGDVLKIRAKVQMHRKMMAQTKDIQERIASMRARAVPK